MPPIVTVEQPPGWRPEREYAARVLLEEILGLEIAVVPTEAPAPHVSLSVTGETGRVLVADGLFALPEELRLRTESLPDEDPPTLDGVPILYGRPLESDHAEVIVGGDIFGSAFFCLSRYEEIVKPAADEHGRFSAADAYATRNGFLRRPVVNEWAELLRRALLRVWPRLPEPPRRFAVVPTHDVDWPWTPERTAGERLGRAAADLVRRRDLRTAVARLGTFAGGRDPFDTFDWIMDASEARGLASAFYFIVDGPAPELGCGYGIDDPAVRTLIGTCGRRGHEIGLHGSYASLGDGARLRRELETLRAVCRDEHVEQHQWGGRQHYLRWDAGQTWRHWDGAGLDYDSTLGYHDAPGFRCGTCSEFNVFDHHERRQLALRERPLVVMEVALDRDEPDVAARANVITELKNQCRRHGGLFVVLWHNSRLSSRQDRRLYLHALDC